MIFMPFWTFFLRVFYSVKSDTLPIPTQNFSPSVCRIGQVSMYSKTCVNRNLCNPFSCVIQHWFPCPLDNFLCVLHCVIRHLVYSVTKFLPLCMSDLTCFTVLFLQWSWKMKITLPSIVSFSSADLCPKQRPCLSCYDKKRHPGVLDSEGSLKCAKKRSNVLKLMTNIPVGQ